MKLKNTELESRLTALEGTKLILNNMAKKSTTKREPVRPKPLTPKAGLKKERYENGGSVKK